MPQILKQVTYLTQKDLKMNEVILPAEYSTTFGKYAKDLNFDLDDEEIVLKDLHQDIDKIDFIVKETNNNINTLKESTQSAKVAIEKKDTKSLSDITLNLEKIQEKIAFLEKELFSDTLTKAYNRKWFADMFLEDDKFKNDGFLAFIDVDKFKRINDNFGHLLGDQVLKYLVHFLNRELKESDVKVVRYAGDEFIVIFPENLSLDNDIEKKMLSVQKKLSNQKLKSGKVEELKFSFSFGLVNFKANEELSCVITNADELMYKNKKR
jgi:diguanylate cyclase (GGDEF)-like protein